MTADQFPMFIFYWVVPGNFWIKNSPQMWVIPKGGAPRPAGLFQSEGGTALHILSGPVDLATLGAIAVTLEPEAGSQAPTSTPIIVAAVAGL